MVIRLLSPNGDRSPFVLVLCCIVFQFFIIKAIELKTIGLSVRFFLKARFWVGYTIQQ